MNILGNNPKYWRNFAKLWIAYEYIIFRFLYGEYTSPRQQIEKYAKPISKSLIDDFERIENIINRRLQIIKEKEIPSNIIKYSRVYLNDPIELADLIFNNNLDKLYFLRQYYKDLSIGSEPLTKSKSFTYK